jgi:DNA-binding NtrC family response regulator
LPEALGYLVRYNWPGNIRELENAIERAVVVGTTDVIRPEDLPDAVLDSHGGPAASSATTVTYHDGVREARKQLITNAVTAAHGTITEAARLLDVHPNYLHMLISNLGLRQTLKK